MSSDPLVKVFVHNENRSIAVERNGRTDTEIQNEMYELYGIVSVYGSIERGKVPSDRKKIVL